MLISRETIRQDKAFDLLTDAILQRDQPRTADLFYGMVAREGRPVGASTDYSLKRGPASRRVPSKHIRCE